MPCNRRGERTNIIEEELSCRLSSVPYSNAGYSPLRCMERWSRPRPVEISKMAEGPFGQSFSCKWESKGEAAKCLGLWVNSASLTYGSRDFNFDHFAWRRLPWACTFTYISLRLLQLYGTKMEIH